MLFSKSILKETLANADCQEIHEKIDSAILQKDIDLKVGMNTKYKVHSTLAAKMCANDIEEAGIICPTSYYAPAYSVSLQN